MSHSALHRLILLALSLWLTSTAAKHNVTIDDTDPSIVYQGNWTTEPFYKSQSYNGSHHVSTDPSAKATFTFVGVAVYYIMPWVGGSTLLSLDGAPAEFVNLTNPNGLNATNVYDIHWRATGLSNGTHTVVSSLQSDGQVARFGEVDGFIITVLDGSDTSSTSGLSAQKKAIVGGTVGGVVGAAILAAIAFVNAHHLQYLFGSLAASILGLFLFKARRMVFVADKHLPQTQISLFLTRHQSPSDYRNGEAERIIVWQKFDIGGANPDFNVTVPSISGRSASSGGPKLGFGSINDDGDAQRVTCDKSEMAPARLLADSTWEKFEEVQEEHNVNALARNEANHPVRIALGIFDDSDQTSLPFRPFLVVEEFPKGAVFKYSSDLYLHAFRTNGYDNGQYGSTLLQAVAGDRLTPENGIRISELSPLTTWYIRQGKDGNLKMKIGANRRSDVKAYQHECKIEKASRKKDGREPRE